MTDTRSVILAFSRVLDGGWHAVRTVAQAIDPGGEDRFLSDWAQANWEMVVEGALSQEANFFLEVYGDGADCNNRSSRVFMPGSLATHTVNCIPLDNGIVLKDILTTQPITLPSGGVPLDRLVRTTPDGWFAEAPPFDHVLIDLEGTQIVVPIQQLDFRLAPKC